jgi:hypothetical protein
MESHGKGGTQQTPAGLTADQLALAMGGGLSLGRPHKSSGKSLDRILALTSSQLTTLSGFRWLSTRKTALVPKFDARLEILPLHRCGSTIYRIDSGTRVSAAGKEPTRGLRYAK